MSGSYRCPDPWLDLNEHVLLHTRTWLRSGLHRLTSSPSAMRAAIRALGDGGGEGGGRGGCEKVKRSIRPGLTQRTPRGQKLDETPSRLCRWRCETWECGERSRVDCWSRYHRALLYSYIYMADLSRIQHILVDHFCSAYIDALSNPCKSSRLILLRQRFPLPHAHQRSGL